MSGGIQTAKDADAAAVAIAAVGLRLPSGRSDFDGGKVVVRLAGSDGMKRAAARLKGLDGELFLAPKVDEKDGELVLSYNATTGSAVPFDAVAASWRAEPATSLPLALSLARFLVRAARERRKHELAALPPVLAHVWFTDDRDDPWRLALVPVVAAPSLAEWAQADEGARRLVAPELLLERDGGARPRGDEADAFAVGAALHEALAGDLFPSLLPAGERLRRRLRGRVGQAQAVHRAVEAGLPLSLSDEGRLLERLVLDLIDAHPERRPSLAATEERLMELAEGALPAHRVATRWEHIGQRDLALRLLERHAATAPRAQVRWETVSRLREEKRDLTGALEAAARALYHTPEQSLRNYLQLLRRVTARESPGVDANQLRAGIGKLSLLPDGALDEELRLQVAHLEARHLAAPDAALARLEAPCEITWNEAMRSLMTARLLAEREEYELVSRHCKQARAQLGTLPERGGAMGKYADAYLHLLDGIVHIGAVARYKNPSFLNDAFERLVKATDLAMSGGADELLDGAVGWLVWMSGYASQFGAEPHFGMVRVGVEAYLAATRLRDRVPPGGGVPALPWYDERLLFPS